MNTMETRYFLLDTGAKIEQEELNKVIDVYTKALNAIANNWTEAEEIQEIINLFPDAVDWINTVRLADLDNRILGVIMLAQLSFDINELKYYFDREGIKTPSLFDFTRMKKRDDGSTERDIEIFNRQLPDIADEMNTAGKLQPPVRLGQRGIMNDKLVNDMLKGERTPKETKDRTGATRYMVAVNQAPKKSKKSKKPVSPVVTYYGLTAPDGTQIMTSRYIDGDDLDIMETAGSVIITELQKGRHFPVGITPAELWRKRNGIDDTGITPSPAQYEEIRARMDNMRFTRLFMDMKQEREEHYIDHLLKDDRITDDIADTYFIEASFRGGLTEKGRIIGTYYFDRLPFLFEYNMAKGHVLLPNAELLDTADTTSGLEGIEPVRRYLVSQIELMYNRKRDSTTIRYDAVYKDGGIKTPEERITAEGRTYKNDASRRGAIRNMEKNDRDHIAAILESWKKRQYILDYEQVKDRGKYTGVKITLNPKNYRDADREN